MSSPTSDEISRLGRLEGQVAGMAERVPRMQKELGRLRAKMMELARGFSTMNEYLVYISDFLRVRSTIDQHKAEIARLRQARLHTTLSPTLSRGSAEGSRAPVPVYSGDRSTLSNFLKLFQTWTMAHDAGNTLANSEPIRAVGKERAKLDSVIAIWTGLV